MRQSIGGTEEGSLVVGVPARLFPRHVNGLKHGPALAWLGKLQSKLTPSRLQLLLLVS